MNTFILKMAVPALALSCVLPAAAQSHPAKRDIGTVEVVNNDTVNGTRVYEEMKQNAPQVYSIPDAPRFAIAGKNGKFYLGIGGSVKGTASFDFGDPITNANMFTTYDIDMNPTPGNGGLLQLSAQQSGLFVNFVAMPGTKNRLGMYVYANFLGNGNGYGFMLQHAYLTYRGFKVGYGFGIFSDPAASAPTIDFEGPNALTVFPSAVLNYTHAFSKAFSVGIGAELPQASYTTSASTATVSQRIPDIPAYLQYSWDGGNSWLRGSAILRNMAYRDLLSRKNVNEAGWGVKASGAVALTPALTFYYQGAYGKGLTSYFQDTNGAGLDLVPDADEPGHLKAVKAWGAYGALQYNFSSKVFATCTYSHLRTYADPYKGGATEWGDQYKYAQYAVANVFYSPNSFIQLGLEYIWGRRVNFSGDNHHNNRIQAMMQISF